MPKQPSAAAHLPSDETAARLAGLALFRGLSQPALHHVRAGFRTCELQSGETLFQKGDAGDGVYVLLSGQLVGHVVSEDGRDLVLTTLRPTCLFGELAALDHLPRSLTIRARVAAQLLHMPERRFMDLLETEPRIAINLASELSRRNRALNTRVFGLVMHDVETRLCDLILQLARQTSDVLPGAIIDPAPTHEVIAAEIGANREAVSRAMSRLNRLGVIEARRGRIVLHDIAALSARISE